ncbi:aldo/keto reductase [Kitasatospora sp. MMS16-BH015]|uniref:aldo/keto reductase n=1 Tax=Kitasatospora sp. MMS16-BH015 TaxID=2018025 RepID=UPI000CA37F9D|nr:aldo/keto reductase [Kitasatospora sp. MMS16-BH015]AUG75469.1 aldo/keto reductase [Kitasatospora sp. MMS16-BH015]
MPTALPHSPSSSFSSSSVARFGLGTAAVGRPGYITLGRAADLPAERTVDALRERTHELLDAAYAAGVRYFDSARSYGRAEEFLGGWLAARPEAAAKVTVGSKWGYTYTADWRTSGVAAHEVKEHSVAVFDRQITETRALLGRHLDVYLVHSVTPESPALTDPALHERLAALAAEGVRVGLSTSGPAQAEAIRAALALTVDGRPLFSAVQSTWNLLETSTAPALAEAHAAGWLVVVKEAMANGRLADRNATGPDTAPLRTAATEAGTTCDALALAAAAAHPWADLVLSGAATPAQLTSNLTAATLTPTPADLTPLTPMSEPAETYWRTRATLPWS